MESVSFPLRSDPASPKFGFLKFLTDRTLSLFSILVLGPELSATLTDPMLNYVDWFNAEICGDKVSRKVRIQ